MITDPPYGVEYNASWRHDVFPGQRHAVGAVLNDHEADWTKAYALFPGDVIFSWHAGLSSDTVANALRRADFEIRSQIIWVGASCLN